MSYLAVIETTPTGYSGFIPDLDARVMVAMPTLDALRKHLSEGLALYLRDHPDAPPATSLQLSDLTDLEDTSDLTAEMITPAALNPVSLELASAVRAAQMRPADLARKLNVTRASVSRLLDPFYFGQSLESLRKIADALGAELTVQLKVPR